MRTIEIGLSLIIVYLNDENMLGDAAAFPATAGVNWQTHE